MIITQFIHLSHLKVPFSSILVDLSQFFSVFGG